MPNSVKNGTYLHSIRYGSGERILICFHGYGQDARVFESLSIQLDDYQLISVDLFFHGQSEWIGEETTLSVECWKRLFFQFLEEHQIQRFSLCGFSMGGRVALTTYALAAERVDELILIAPDGIYTNIWNRLATSSALNQFIFRKLTIDQFAWLDTIRYWIEKLHLLDKSLLKLYKTQMDDPKLREKLYKTWMLYRELNVSVSQLVELIEKYQTPVSIFAGRYDRIISSRQMEHFRKRIPHCRFEILEAGHHKLIQATALRLQGKRL
jgi:pimeloyl-ACP methyl ester carboxylesterase